VITLDDDVQPLSINFLQNRLVPFPGWRSLEVTKPGFSFYV